MTEDESRDSQQRVSPNRDTMRDFSCSPRNQRVRDLKTEGENETGTRKLPENEFVEPSSAIARQEPVFA